MSRTQEQQIEEGRKLILQLKSEIAGWEALIQFRRKSILRKSLFLYLSAIFLLNGAISRTARFVAFREGAILITEFIFVIATVYTFPHVVEIVSQRANSNSLRSLKQSNESLRRLEFALHSPELLDSDG